MIKLGEIRRAQGMTQRDLAVATGLALSTIVETEAGRTIPRVNNAQKIATALGVSVNEIWPYDFTSEPEQV